jgi:hypothetical protein
MMKRIKGRQEGKGNIGKTKRGSEITKHKSRGQKKG